MNSAVKQLHWVALLGVSAALRLVHNGDAFWLDEAAALLIAWDGPLSVVEPLRVDSTPPLYYGLLGAWLKLFGAGEMAVRGLSALFGVLSVGLGYYATRVLMPNRLRWAWGVAWLLAVHPLAVYYGREARMYAMTPLFSAWILAATVQAARMPTARHLGALVVALVLGLYTHNTFVFLLPAVPLVGLAVADDRLRRAVRLAGASALAFALFGPWVPILLGQASSGVTAWIPAVWEATGPTSALWASFEALGVTGTYPDYLREMSALGDTWALPWLWSVVRGVGIVLGVGLTALGLRTLWQDRVVCAAVVSFVLSGTLVPWAVSFVKPIYLVGRYELLVLPAVAFLWVAGLGALVDAGRGRLATVLGGLWLAAAAVIVGAVVSGPQWTFQRDVADRLSERVRSDDLVIFADYAYAVPEVYLRARSSDATRLTYPPTVAKHPGWYDFDTFFELGPAGVIPVTEQLAAAGRVALAAGGRVFLVDTQRSIPRVRKVNDLLRMTLRKQLGREHLAWVPDRNGPPAITVFTPDQAPPDWDPFAK